MFSDGTYGGGGSSASGEVTASFTWTKDYPSDTSLPPTSVYVDEYSKVSAASPVAGTLPVVLNDLDPLPATTVAAHGVVTSTSEGHRITYKPIANGQITFTVAAGPLATGMSSASVRYKAKVTTFFCWISSPADPSYHKGYNDQPVLNYGNGLTPSEADTWVDPASFAEYDLSGFFDFDGFFVANLVGAWTNPYFSWNADPFIYTDDLLHEYSYIEPTWSFSPASTESLKYGPITKTIQLRAVSNGGSGATSSAVYTLRIHNKYENWETVGQLPDHWTPVTLVDDPKAYAGGSVEVSWDEPDAKWNNVQSGICAGAEIAGAILESPWLAVGFSLLNITVDLIGPRSKTSIAPWAWNADGHFPESMIDNDIWPATYDGYIMSPVLKTKSEEWLQSADEYGQHGYIGKAYDVKSKVIQESYQWSGYFYREGDRVW